MNKSLLALLILSLSQSSLASQALIDAAREGDLAQVTRLIAENDNVNDVDQLGRTALMRAAFFGHIEVVDALLAHPEIQINLASRVGDTALLQAALIGRIEVVPSLLTHPKILINLADKRGETALMKAAFFGHIEVVSALLAHSKILTDLTDKKGDTALMKAVNEGYTEVAQLLVIENISYARSHSHLISSAIEQVTPLPTELSDTITDYLTGFDNATSHVNEFAVYTK